jgi:hypothetical protein
MLYFSILLHYYISHPLVSVYNATQPFILKCHLQARIKFIKCLYLLQYFSALQGHRQATVSWSKTLDCVSWNVSIFTCYYFMSSWFENVRTHFTHAIFMLLRPRNVPLCVVYLSQACVSCNKGTQWHRNKKPWWAKCERTLACISSYSAAITISQLTVAWWWPYGVETCCSN